MARVIKSKVKIKELPEQFKVIKKEEASQSQDEPEEQEESELEADIESGFTPKLRSGGLEAPVLEASSNLSQATFSSDRERKKEDNNKITAPEYKTATVYNMPDYSPSQQTVRQQTRTEPILHTRLVSESGERQQVRMQEWHEISQAREQGTGRQEAVIGVSQLEKDNKLPFQQDTAYNPRRKKNI